MRQRSSSDSYDSSCSLNVRNAIRLGALAQFAMKQEVLVRERAEIKVQIQNAISAILLPSAQHLDASDEENGFTLHVQMGLGRCKPVGMGWRALPGFRSNTHLGFYLQFV